jgi:predicted transcriptional regulator of viral defense system
MGESFCGRVLAAFAGLAPAHPAGVPIREVGYAVDIDAGAAAARRLRKTICDLKARGRLRHVGPGLYLPAVPAAAGGRPDGDDDGRARMWRALRLAHKRGNGVHIDDLARLADVGPTYAKEFLNTLCRRGIVARIGRTLPAVYRMVQDPVEMPELNETAKRLRRMRRQRALAEIDAARAALERAAGILEEGDDETDE